MGLNLLTPQFPIQMVSVTSSIQLHESDIFIQLKLKARALVFNMHEYHYLVQMKQVI